MLMTAWDRDGMVTRRAGVADASTVAEIVRTACTASMHDGFPLSGIHESEAEVLRDMEHKEAYLLCRAVDGFAVATLRLHMPASADYLYITRVAVRPGWQGRGLAGRLLTFAEGEAARRGLRAVRLDTPDGYRRLERLYHRYGFEPAEYITLPGRAYPSVILERALVP